MSRKHLLFRALIVIISAVFSTTANAWFIFFPLPNLAKPAPLNAIIEAYEKSEETKALATVSEDKTFGAKYWVWGHYSGHVTQAEADRVALAKCQESLANAKAQQVGGTALYDFGSKVCELYAFENKTVSPLATKPQVVPSSPASNPPSSVDSSTTPSSTPSQSNVQPSVPQGGSLSPTGLKLRELNELLKEGLISEQEYDEKRKAILSNM